MEAHKAISDKDFGMLKAMALAADSAKMRIDAIRARHMIEESDRRNGGRYQEIFKDRAKNDPDVGVRGEAYAVITDLDFLRQRHKEDSHLLGAHYAREAIEQLENLKRGELPVPMWEVF